MADADKKDKKEQPGTSFKIDPALEAKVDKMMNPSSAPLLPDDKLPDFSKPQQKPVEPEVQKPEEEPEPETKSAPPEQTEQSDPGTDKAVDEIAREESDRMLAIEDAKAELLAEGTAEIDKGLANRIKEKIAAFWHNKKARNTVLASLFLAIFAAFAVPVSRYLILNSLGVRASVSLRVIDDKTTQPLKNVMVSVGDKSDKTDISGQVTLTGIKLGKQQLVVKKPAFADVNQSVTLGWGSNPRGDVGLTAVGSRYTFEIKDYVSAQPVVGAEATSGEASATANQNGEIVLVVADQGQEEINIQIKAPGYRSDDLTLEVGDKQSHQISLVPAKKHAFVSKRNGKYDLYKIDVDGKNEKLVLAGTGSESEARTAILDNQTSNTIAYVTTRGERHNNDGYALSSLMIINLDTDKAETIDYSERIQPVDFIGSRFVYVKIVEGQSGASPNRHQLISYDINTKEQKTLAKANYFNDVLSARGIIYYAPAAYKTDTGAGLFSISPDGSNKKLVYGKEVWNLFRVAYDKVDAAVGQSWYEYNIGSGIFNALGEAPAQQESRIYADSPDAGKSAWVDERDGKGVLIIYDVATGQEKVLQSQGGLTNPIGWIDNDHIIYRIANNSETADYIVSISGGTPKKIRDVTNIAGLDRWYYY